MKNKNLSNKFVVGTRKQFGSSCFHALLATYLVLTLYYCFRFSMYCIVCIVSVVVAVDAELDEWSVADDVSQTEDKIVSQWREVSGDEQHQLRDRFDEILRPLGFDMSLVVIRRANSLAFYFMCLTLAALLGLRDQWRSGQLRDIVQSLFTFLTGAGRTVHVKKISWPLTNYERCLDFFSSVQGKQLI